MPDRANHQTITDEIESPAGLKLSCQVIDEVVEAVVDASTIEAYDCLLVGNLIRSNNLL